jgi:hypothetical protein
MKRVLIVISLLTAACGGDSSDSGPNPCLETQSCSIFGKCTPLHGVCMAAGDADCAQSKNCADFGECFSAPPRWDNAAAEHTAHLACWARAKDVSECRAEDARGEGSQCTSGGRCDVKNGFCVASMDPQCLDSQGCAIWGACKYADGECWVPAESSAECVDPPNGPYDENGCQQFGFCTAKNGVCQAWSPGDCTNAFVCQEWGECTALDGECWQSSE